MRAVISLRALVLVMLAVALTSTGFAHRMPDPQDQAMVLALAAGVLPSDFCGDAPGQMPGDPHCMACQIAGSVDLPLARVALADLGLVLVVRVDAPRESLAPRRVLDPARSPQGPPAA